MGELPPAETAPGPPQRMERNFAPTRGRLQLCRPAEPDLEPAFFSFFVHTHQSVRSLKTTALRRARGERTRGMLPGYSVQWQHNFLVQNKSRKFYRPFPSPIENRQKRKGDKLSSSSKIEEIFLSKSGEPTELLPHPHRGIPLRASRREAAGHLRPKHLRIRHRRWLRRPVPE